MYNQPYFIPNYYSAGAIPNMMRGAGTGAMMASRAASGAGRGLGLMGRLGSGFSALRSINWGGLINNASKTLGVINQTIPLVRQVGPMFHNMRSMLKVASVFKDETDRKQSSKRNTTSIRHDRQPFSSPSTNARSNATTERTHHEYGTTTEEHSFENSSNYDNAPTFFIDS